MDDLVKPDAFQIITAATANKFVNARDGSIVMMDQREQESVFVSTIVGIDAS